MEYEENVMFKKIRIFFKKKLTKMAKKCDKHWEITKKVQKCAKMCKNVHPWFLTGNGETVPKSQPANHPPAGAFRPGQGTAGREHTTESPAASSTRHGRAVRLGAVSATATAAVALPKLAPRMVGRGPPVRGGGARESGWSTWTHPFETKKM